MNLRSKKNKYQFNFVYFNGYKAMKFIYAKTEEEAIKEFEQLHKKDHVIVTGIYLLEENKGGKNENKHKKN